MSTPTQNRLASPFQSLPGEDVNTRTKGSKFGDSAIDIDVPLSPFTPTGCPSYNAVSPMAPDTSVTVSSQTRSQPPSLSPSPSPPGNPATRNHVSLSTRLSFLSSLALSEQSLIPSQSLDALHAHLDYIQRGMTSSPHEPPPMPEGARASKQQTSSRDDPRLLAESQKTLAHLTSSLATLQRRREETLNTHSHLTGKLNDLISVNQAQSSQIGQLNTLVSDLSMSNTKLTNNCDDLRDQVLELSAREEILEARAHDLSTTNSSLTERLNRIEQHNLDLQTALSSSERSSLEDEVALEAMSAAVGGLEGWMDDYIDQHTKQSPIPFGLKGSSNMNGGRGNHQSSPSEPTIRGRGRFRGRYDPTANSIGPMSPPATPSHTSRSNDWSMFPNETMSVGRDTRRQQTTQSRSQLQIQTHILEFEEGVRSWIKGFRDVEESIRTRIRTRHRNTGGDDETKEAMKNSTIDSLMAETDTMDGTGTDVFDAGDGGDEFGDYETVTTR